MNIAVALVRLQRRADDARRTEKTAERAGMYARMLNARIRAEALEEALDVIEGSGEAAA